MRVEEVPPRRAFGWTNHYGSQTPGPEFPKCARNRRRIRAALETGVGGERVVQLHGIGPARCPVSAALRCRLTL